MLKIGHIPESCANTQNEFTEGIPSQDIPATYTKAAWFNTLQRELVNVVEKFGGRLNPALDEQIYEMIAKATPLQTQDIPRIYATTGLLCLPQILSVDGCWRISIHGNGTITIDRDQSLIWRGIWEINTSSYSLTERTFTTQSNKIYHLRWLPEIGFTLNNLTDINYNPNHLSEKNVAFDSSYDDMLIASIITDVNNLPDITPLKNKAILQTCWDITTTPIVRIIQDGTLDILEPNQHLPLNWARTPKIYFTGVSGFNLGYEFRSATNRNDNTFGVIATRNEACFYNYHANGKTQSETWRFYLQAES